MILDGQVLAFAVVALVLSVTPGPDMALVLRNTLRGGRGAGLRTVGGIAVGLGVWASASALGVAAVLAASTTLFTALKLAGAAYLVYLGVRALLTLRERHDEAVPAAPRLRGSPFRQGLFTNLLNPKLAVMFTTLLPQFISPDDPPGAKAAVLAAVFLAIGLTWLVAYTHLVSVIAGSRTFRRVTEALSGVVLVALGARLAVER